MGVALAQEARSRGADVTLLAANLAVEAPAGVTVIETPTAADLEREALGRADADIIVMAAAVADYRPPSALAEKRPKDGARWTVELEPTPDVLSALGSARREGQVLVGFAADGSESGLARAREKRLAKGSDLFVFNDIGRARHRLRCARERSRRHLGERGAGRAEGAQARGRRGDPGRGGAATLDGMSDPAPAREAVSSALAADVVERVVANLELAVRAPRETLELCVLGLLAEGHLLIEDFPGVGKTVLAKSLARSLHLDFSRLQFTPDLLPTDVTGVNVFNQRTNEFEFRPGPVFTNVLLVDEINRASPKTQAALLEAMQECQVTIDGETYPLELPFLVVATQNPIEYEGTYPLPEAQLDRFSAMLSLGYPPLAEEARMLAEQTTDPPLDRLRAVVRREDVLMAIEAARVVYVEESINRYVVGLLAHTRQSAKLALGASPRAGIALLRMAKARAVAAGRDYVLPEDVQAIALAVLSHRVIVSPEARAAGTIGREVVQQALAETRVPA